MVSKYRKELVPLEKVLVLMISHLWLENFCSSASLVFGQPQKQNIPRRRGAREGTGQSRIRL